MARFGSPSHETTTSAFYGLIHEAESYERLIVGKDESELGRKSGRFVAALRRSALEGQYLLRVRGDDAPETLAPIRTTPGGAIELDDMMLW